MNAAHSPHRHASPDEAPPESIRRLVLVGSVDPELGALIWTLMEHGVPLLVCGPADVDLRAISDSLGEIAPARTLADGRAAKPTRELRAASLKEAFEILAGAPFNLSDDELRDLGLVLILEAGRATAAHYVRPIERDREGHLQHRPPAVLATWNAERQRFEHFSWAVTPELAARVGTSQAEFEELVAARAHALGHAGAGALH